jgi:putative ABC transport system permease protein
MRWIAAARERLAALFFRSRQDAELDEELRFHLEQEAALLRDAGLDPEEARRQARQCLGGVEQCKEAVRDARGLGLVEDLARDAVIAARNLTRMPALSLGVAVTLGLGIGAATTIYAVVDGVMLRRLPYDEPSTLVTVGSPSGSFVAPGLQDLGPISILYYEQLRERARSFEMLSAVNTRRLMPLAAADGGQEEVPAIEISVGLLELLNASSPALGRAFLPEEYATPEGGGLLTQEGAVMVTFEEWQGRYGGDTTLIGRTIGHIRGGRFPAVVIGVLPSDFRPLEAFFASGERPGYYFPRAAEGLPADRGWETWYVLGRLRPGVSIDNARAEVERVAADIARESPAAVGLRQRNGAPYRIGLNGLQAHTVGASGRLLGLFLGAAALLLVLATMNAATLLLARSLDRSKEFALRMALGAGRMRVIRLMLCETGMLALAGGALGALIAFAGVGAFLRFAPSSIPRLNAVALDTRVLTMAAAISIAAGVAVGLLPALRLTRGGPWEPLQASAPSLAEPTSRLRTVLVAGQMTLAIVLLAGAGLLFNSFVRMQSLDPGIDADRLVTVVAPYKDAASVARLSLPQAWDRILEELRAVPGVEMVAGTTTAPFQTPFWSLRVQLPGDDRDTWRDGIAGYAITPDYLDAVGTRLLRGRNFERLDGTGTERVALVNESFVRTQLGGRDPIGTVVRASETDDSARIVGVVEDVIQRRAEDGFRPAIYVPYTQYDRTSFVVAVVRTTLPAEALLDDLRAASVRLIPGRQPNVRVMRDLMASTRTSPRFQTLLVGAFALIATALAAVGIYGAMAHFVRRRRRELGIRMALGANRRDVVRMIVGRGLRLSAGGLAVGMVAALFLSRAMRGFLYGVEPHDPATLIAVAVTLVLVSVLAALVPARRATKVDPVLALKVE